MNIILIGLMIGVGIILAPFLFYGAIILSVVVIGVVVGLVRRIKSALTGR